MPQSHQNWQYLGANGYIGGYTTTGGGGTPIVPRSDLDFLRLGVGRKPEAEYPDGYLGTIRSRRDDRGKPYATSDTVLDSLKNRQNQRGYQRGVHKGERIDQAQYYWPEGLNPARRLNQKLYNVANNEGGIVMTVPRNKPKMNLAPAPHLVNDGKANVSSNVPAEFNPTVSRQFTHLRPHWN
jgi:hypothetical protein